MTDMVDPEISLTQVWGEGWRLGDGTCGHCDRSVAFKTPDEGNASWSVQIPTETEHPDEPDLIENHVFVVGICPRPSCRRPTIVHELRVWHVGGWSGEAVESREIVYPHSSSRPALDSEVPEELRTLYSEASTIEYLSPNGSAFLARRILEQVLRGELKKKGRLVKLIDEFLQKETLPSSLEELMHDVRQFGNIAAHPGQADDGDWIGVDQGEASYVLDVVGELLDYVYVRPTRQQAMRERWQAKKKGERPPEPSPRVEVIRHEEKTPPKEQQEPPLSEPDDDLPF